MTDVDDISINVPYVFSVGDITLTSMPQRIPNV